MLSRSWRHGGASTGSERNEQLHSDLNYITNKINLNTIEEMAAARWAAEHTYWGGGDRMISISARHWRRTGSAALGTAIGMAVSAAVHGADTSDTPDTLQEVIVTGIRSSL